MYVFRPPRLGAYPATASAAPPLSTVDVTWLADSQVGASLATQLLCLPRSQAFYSALSFPKRQRQRQRQRFQQQQQQQQQQQHQHQQDSQQPKQASSILSSSASSVESWQCFSQLFWASPVVPRIRHHCHHHRVLPEVVEGVKVSPAAEEVVDA